MQNEKFDDHKWPYSLQISGSFIESPDTPLNKDRFLVSKAYHHFSSALADMLSLSGELFEQEIAAHGWRTPLYKDVAILDTATRKEIASFLCLPLSSAIRTGESAGLYLALEQPAAQVAQKYKVPLDTLNGYDPRTSLLDVAAYDTSFKNIIRVDPTVEKLLEVLGQHRQELHKDTHEVTTAFYTPHGGMRMDMSHHFDSLAHGFDGLLHAPLHVKLPPIHRTMALIADKTVLKTKDAEIAAIHFEPYKGQNQVPPAGFHLSFSGNADQMQKELGVDLSVLPVFRQADTNLYTLALAKGGRPEELRDFTFLRENFHDKFLASQKALRKYTYPKGFRTQRGSDKPRKL